MMVNRPSSLIQGDEMQLTEVFAKLQGLDIYEERSATNELVDVVFESKHAVIWQERMESILGPALKPQGEKGGSQAKKLTKAFGGVRPEQTVFYQAFGDYAVLALFWPWGNGRCTTCKVFQLSEILPEESPSFFSRIFKK